MTLTIDPVAITTLVVVMLAAIGGFIWFGKLSSRVERLEADVAELKQGQKEILALLHQRDREIQEMFRQRDNEILELLHQHIGYHQGLTQVGSPPAPPAH